MTTAAPTLSTALDKWSDVQESIDKETEVEKDIIEPILHWLGYEHQTTYKKSVTLDHLRLGSQKAKKKSVTTEADFVLGNKGTFKTPGKPWAVVEAKKDYAGRDSFRAQAQSYADHLKTPYYLLIGRRCLLLYRRCLTSEDELIRELALHQGAETARDENIQDLWRFLNADTLPKHCETLRKSEEKNIQTFIKETKTTTTGPENVIIRQADSSIVSNIGEKKFLDATFWWGEPNKRFRRQSRDIAIDLECHPDDPLGRLLLRIIAHHAASRVRVRNDHADAWKDAFKQVNAFIHAEQPQVDNLQAVDGKATDQTIDARDQTVDTLKQRLNEWFDCHTNWLIHEVIKRQNDQDLLSTHRGTWTKELSITKRLQELEEEEASQRNFHSLRSMLRRLDGDRGAKSLHGQEILSGPQTTKYVVDGWLLALAISDAFENIGPREVTDHEMRNIGTTEEDHLPCGTINALPVVTPDGLADITTAFRDTVAVLAFTQLNRALPPADWRIGDTRQYRGDTVRIGEDTIDFGLTLALTENIREQMASDGWSAVIDGLRAQRDDQFDIS